MKSKLSKRLPTALRPRGPRRGRKQQVLGAQANTSISSNNLAPISQTSSSLSELSDSATLVTQEKIYKVFVSSTYEDLREERAAVQKALLQLGCLPVGMELFPAANEETWQFIKDQIDDSDYYIVVISGRYGSQASDGISYTEKEYTYALRKKKPLIAFVHEQRLSLPANKVESSAALKKRLERFIKKVQVRLTRPFNSPHQLALEVTQSFVQLIRRNPQIGYIRADQAADFKKYALILEKYQELEQSHRTLKEKIESKQTDALKRPIIIKMTADRRDDDDPSGLFTVRKAYEVEIVLAELFCAICKLITTDNRESCIAAGLRQMIVGRLRSRHPGTSIFNETLESIAEIRDALYAMMLINVGLQQSWEDRSRLERFWTLTLQGREQFLAAQEIGAT